LFQGTLGWEQSLLEQQEEDAYECGKQLPIKRINKLPVSKLQLPQLQQKTRFATSGQCKVAVQAVPPQGTGMSGGDGLFTTSSYHASSASIWHVHEKLSATSSALFTTNSSHFLINFFIDFEG